MRGADRLQRFQDTIRKRFAKGSIILLYHRVTDLQTDPQMLSVSPHHFAQHMNFLRRHAQPVSLQHLARHTGGPPSVAVTFDDGYADNLHEAKPLLEKNEVPATVFVAAGYVGGDREFWWDELERIILDSPKLPDSIAIDVEGKRHAWSCQGSTRSDTYNRVSGIVKPLPLDKRERVLSYLRSWAGQPLKCRQTHRPLDFEELRQLQKGGSIEIGSHTLSHPVLSKLKQKEQADQICNGKSRLEQLLGRPITSFAYPFGKREDYNSNSVAVVRKAGIDVACSNFEGLVWPGTSRLELPRMLVRNWDGEEFARRFRSWID